MVPDSRGLGSTPPHVAACALSPREVGREGGKVGPPPKAFSPSSCPGVSVGTQAGPGGEGLEGLGVSLPSRRLL